MQVACYFVETPQEKATEWNRNHYHQPNLPLIGLYVHCTLKISNTLEIRTIDVEVNIECELCGEKEESGTEWNCSFLNFTL